MSKIIDWQVVAFNASRRPADGGPSDEGRGRSSARASDVWSDDAGDVDARVRLAGFYFLRLSPEHHRRRAEHLEWLAEHRPDIGLGGFGYIVEEQASEGHEGILVTRRRAARHVVMRKLKTLAATLGILSLGIFPAVGAMFELGGSLSRIERMHARMRASSAGVETAMIGTYDLDPATLEPGVRFRTMEVRRR